MSDIVWPLLVALFLALISVLAYFLVSRLKRNPQISLILISLSVGALLGDSFFHLLPESLELYSASSVLNLVLLGLVLFFLLERLIMWRHCHEIDCPQDLVEGRSSIASVSLVGDLFHNFFDGLVIAASFAYSFPLGLASSLAVVLHEIPQEIGDMTIYLHSGLSSKKTIIYNLLSSLSAFVAVILFYVFGLNQSAVSWILPLIAGGFIYLACSDLIPELHRHHPAPANTLLQILGLSLGLMLMFLLLSLE